MKGDSVNRVTSEDAYKQIDRIINPSKDNE